MINAKHIFIIFENSKNVCLCIFSVIDLIKLQQFVKKNIVPKVNSKENFIKLFTEINYNLAYT